MTPEYIPRIADILLKESLASPGAVLIEEPKWCGKTGGPQHRICILETTEHYLGYKN